MRRATLVMIVAPAALNFCASNDLRTGETRELRSNGRVVGSVRQISPTVQEFSYDKNRDGIAEKRWLRENSEMQIFERFDETSGRLRTRSHYFKGVLNRVEVFRADGSVRGIVSYPDGRQAQSVELPKQKKLVEFVKP